MIAKAIFPHSVAQAGRAIMTSVERGARFLLAAVRPVFIFPLM